MAAAAWHTVHLVVIRHVLPTGACQMTTIGRAFEALLFPIQTLSLTLACVVC